MRVSTAQALPAQLAVDALAIATAAGEPLAGTALDLDQALGGILRDAIQAKEHRGRLNEVHVLPTGDRIAARRVILYGLGNPAELDGQRLRYAHHEMARVARGLGYRRLAIVRAQPLGPESLAAAIEGTVMGDWEPRSRQTGAAATHLDELVVSGFGDGRESDIVAALQVGEAVNRTRELQNSPGNELFPESLAEEARRIASTRGLEVEILGPDELRAGGYNLLLGVAAGSTRPPRLIRLEHRGAGGIGPRLALIGKGITFDTGGLSIKSDAHMRDMKGDMAGGAAVLAAIDVIAARRLPIDVMAVVPASENMINGQAQRPGDVWTSADGRTVEVLNTDAEGRLVLADAITYALRRGATHLVDLATLTGAATVAIGHAATAAVASDDRLWAQVAEAADRAGDRVWRLPIYPEYRPLLNSKIADLKNSYYGEAGTITGGMFIQQFTQGRPWVHLDIAASSWNDNGDLAAIPRGPVGAGTRLIIQLAELIAAANR